MNNNSRKKLIPALSMLLISILALTTASYAWFNTSGEAVAQNMIVKTTVSNGLLISNAENGTYGDTALPNATDSAPFGAHTIKPTSSVDGLDFYTVVSGITNDGTYAGSSSDSSVIVKTNRAITTAEDGSYADFHFFLKTTRDECDVYLNNCIVDVHAGSSEGSALNVATRIAVLDPTGEDTAPFAADGKAICYNNIAGNLPNTLTFFAVDGGKQVGPLKATSDDANAWKGEQNTANVKYLVPATVTGSTVTGGTKLFTANSTTPVEMVLRVWVEGQDNHCVPIRVGDIVTVSVNFVSQFSNP